MNPDDLFVEAVRAPVARDADAVLPFPAPLEAIELAAVRAMLDHTEGNKSEAARRLGISRSRLHRALRRIGEQEGEVS